MEWKVSIGVVIASAVAVVVATVSGVGVRFQPSRTIVILGCFLDDASDILLWLQLLLQLRPRVPVLVLVT